MPQQVPQVPEEKKFDPIAQLNQIMKNMQEMTASSQQNPMANQFATASAPQMMNPSMFATNSMMSAGMMP